MIFLVMVQQQKKISRQSENKIKCENYIEGSLAMCTSLVPIIGYDAAAEIAHESFQTGKTIRQVVEEKNIIDRKVLYRVLNPKNMISPQ